MQVRILAAAAAFLFAGLGGTLHAQPSTPRAREIAAWLRTTAVDTVQGRAWPGDALAPAVVDSELGSGTAGVVLFWIAMHRADPAGGYLAEVQRGADYLAAHARTSLAPA